ncbi:MAG: phosphoribosylglycinamide formyltransferase [Pseudomonadota bacterium]
MSKTRIGVLISGRGSNLQALIDACAQEDFPAQIGLVISNRPNAGGLKRAADAGLPHNTISHQDYPSRDAFEDALDQALKAAKVRYVVLAGFMRILTETFVDRWRDRIINIHPSLLPAFRGLDVHARVLESGVRFTGCTVHYVRPEMDDGPIIGQAVTAVQPEDDEETLAARVLELEHRLYPECLKRVIEGRARIVEGRVPLEDEAPSAEALTVPNAG